jgi:hypothetical protein
LCADEHDAAQIDRCAGAERSCCATAAQSGVYVDVDGARRCVPCFLEKSVGGKMVIHHGGLLEADAGVLQSDDERGSLALLSSLEKAVEAFVTMLEEVQVYRAQHDGEESKLIKAVMTGRAQVLRLGRIAEPPEAAGCP